MLRLSYQSLKAQMYHKNAKTMYRIYTYIYFGGVFWNDYDLNKEAQCGYVILIMAIYWMTEALPLPITSLIPVFAFPLFGIMNTGDVCTAYMKVWKRFFCLALTLILNEISFMLIFDVLFHI